MKNYLLLFIAFCFCAPLLFAQSSVSEIDTVDIAYQMDLAHSRPDKVNTTEKKFYYVYPLDETATETVKNICDVFMQNNFLGDEIYFGSASVENAAAVIAQDGKKYVLFNEVFVLEAMLQLQKEADQQWLFRFVIAHELAHHAKMHTTLLANDPKALELEADRIAASILAKMGVDKETLLMVTYILFEHDTEENESHPSMNERLYAIESGWFSAKR